MPGNPILLELVRPSTRERAAAEFARGVGAEAFLILVLDAELGKLLPAPGLPQTLPGGPAWRAFIEACQRLTPSAGALAIHRGDVAWPDRSSTRPACAWIVEQGVFVLLGPALVEEAVDPTLFPVLGALLRQELAVAAADGRAEAAREAARSATSLNEALDLTRSQLQRALEESARLNAELEAAMGREREARTDAEGASRAKDEFLAMLGHELRNPLAPIVTALHLLRRRYDEVPRELDIIGRQVEHVVRLVDDLLDVSRIVRGKISLDREVVEVAAIAASAVEMASPLFEQRRHHFRMEVPRVGLSVAADQRRLAQVVANLLTNAARYTPPGGDIVLTGVLDGQDVVLSVRDNGIGMSAQLLPRVFDLFLQGGHRPSDRGEGGLGIGLALVKSLVALHGGSVYAESAGPGLGSVFTVRLPRVEAPAEVRIDSSAAVIASAPLRVLLVDDNEDATVLLAELLRMHGHIVATAPDGPTALERVDAFMPDVAVLDIGLPVMDGYELARQLVARPSTRHLRLIALSGYGLAQDRARAESAGFHHHLTKPVDLDRLLEALT